MGTPARKPKGTSSAKHYDTVKQREYRETLRSELNRFYERYAPRVKKWLRCMCSVKCRKMMFTDIGHRILANHAHRTEGLMPYRTMPSRGGVKGE